ncbi:MAG TPA: hypothetical protein VGD87_05990 [Archangium sp.]
MRFLATLLVMVPCVVAAYPIPPQSVRQLTEDADLIVVARIADVKVVALPDLDSFAPDTVATLVVEETWNGSAPSTLEVLYGANVSCPAPPRFEVGRRVVAFLSKGEGERYQTVGLSYGTKYPESPAEFEALRKEVAAVVQARRAGGFTLWEERLLLAFARPEERNDLLISMQGDEEGTRALSAKLVDQFERLFIERPSFDAAVPKVLWLIKTRPSKALDAVFADVIETVLSRESAPQWIVESLPLLEARLQKKQRKPRGATTVEAFEVGLGAKQPDDAEVKARWAAMKRAFKLKPSRR